MFINKCSFNINNDMFVISDFIVYNISETDNKLLNFSNIEYSTHKHIIDIYDKATFDIKKWNGGTDLEIIYGNSKIYQNHYISVNDYVYYVTQGCPAIINNIDISNIDNIKKIYIVSSNLCNTYKITPIANCIVEFIQFIKGNAIDFTNVHACKGFIKLDKFTISNNPDYLNNTENPVYIPYIIQYMCYKRYNTTDIFDVLLFLIIRCKVKKITINKDIRHFDYFDDNMLIDNIVENTSRRYIKQNIVTNKIYTNEKLAIILHLENIYQINYFIRVLSEIEYIYDLYVTINGNVNKGILKEILTCDKYNMLNIFFKQLGVSIKYFEVSNIGGDMGPFLLVLQMISTQVKYDYVLKLHTIPERKKRDTIINTIVTVPLKSITEKMKSGEIFGTDCAKYNYKNHIYICYLLNKLGITLFNEQNAIFAEKLYKNIRQGIESKYSDEKMITLVSESCYWVDPNIIYKHKLWEFYDDMEDPQSDIVYQQLPQAVSSLISILHCL